MQSKGTERQFRGRARRGYAAIVVLDGNGGS